MIALRSAVTEWHGTKWRFIYELYLVDEILSEGNKRLWYVYLRGEQVADIGLR